MPHPRFKHQWEEDSYWKHYYNHQEEVAWRQEDAERDAYKAKLKAEAAAKDKAEGWQIVKRR